MRVGGNRTFCRVKRKRCFPLSSHSLPNRTPKVIQTWIIGTGCAVAIPADEWLASTKNEPKLAAELRALVHETPLECGCSPYPQSYPQSHRHRGRADNGLFFRSRRPYDHQNVWPSQERAELKTRRYPQNDGLTAPKARGSNLQLALAPEIPFDPAALLGDT
jgi:hypothetical protein